MRTKLRFAVLPLAVLLVAAGCRDRTGPDEERYTITLGPEGVTTTATGTAEFVIQENGTITYRINVSNLNNFTMTHIHQSSNGAVVVWLRPLAPPPTLVEGVFNGVIAEGTIEDASRLVGPLAGQPLSALHTLMRTGAAYVNVHTQQNPGGEIRGNFVARQ
jgi:hypothetical protein